MKIAVDIDGVLRDSITKMVEIYNKHFNTDMSVNDVKMYDVEKSFPLIRSALGISPHDFFFVTFDNEINLKSPSFKGVQEAISQTREMGNTIHIISYQPSYRNQYLTALWLVENDIEFDSLTLCTKHKKDILDIDIMIDDNPYYFNGVNASRCILINRSYNLNTKQFPNIIGENVKTKNGIVKMERFDSLINFLKTI